MYNWQQKWIDCYKILNIDFNADQVTIKTKYRELAQKYHPDIYKGPEGDKIFIEIKNAYEILSDENEKKKYDEAYLNRLNGNFQENNTPKYTEEEMNNFFSEQEILHAKTTALNNIINEELSKIKNILEAKNNLLLMAYKNNISEEKYQEEYIRFTTVLNDYINLLNNLTSEAKKYGLLKKVDEINQKIDYLFMLCDEIPKSSKIAKDKYKKEEMIRQLQELQESEIQNAKCAVNNFKDLYISVYNNEINKFDYVNYVEALKMNLIDSKIKLSKLVELLKKAKQDITKVSIIIGKCNQMLKMITTDYKTAKLLGEAIIETNNAKNMEYDYKKYEEKIMKIISIIEKYPNNKKVKTLYEYGLSIIEECKEKLNINITYNKNSTSFDKIISMMDEEIKKTYENYKKIVKRSYSLKTSITSFFKKDDNNNIMGFDSFTDCINNYDKLVKNNLDKNKMIADLANVNQLLGQRKMLNEFYNIYIASYENSDFYKNAFENLDNLKNSLDILYNYIITLIQIRQKEYDRANSWSPVPTYSALFGSIILALFGIVNLKDSYYIEMFSNFVLSAAYIGLSLQFKSKVDWDNYGVISTSDFDDDLYEQANSLLTLLVLNDYISAKKTVNNLNESIEKKQKLEKYKKLKFLKKVMKFKK